MLRVTGAEFEGEISFAGLNQVLLPALGDVDELVLPTGTRCG